MASEKAEWKPHGTLLVSDIAGFDADALEEAKRCGIQCFRRMGDGFERVA
jgi:hypothetical protein